MAEENKFVPGMFAKAPREGAPEYIKCAISLKVAELGQFLREAYKAGDEYVNVDIKVSKGGKWYAAVNTWKPEKKGGLSKVGGGVIEDDIPF